VIRERVWYGRKAGVVRRDGEKWSRSGGEAGNDYFFSETTGWNNPFRIGPRKASLANLPEDEDKFPVATWVKRILMEGVQRLALHSDTMRRPSPPGSPAGFSPDGSNLPWAVERLRLKDAARFEQWIAHVRTALRDVRAITTVERPEDKRQVDLGTLFAAGVLG
jgi:hypothetical protein